MATETEREEYVLGYTAADINERLGRVPTTAKQSEWDAKADATTLESTKTALEKEIATKQDIISDLATIRTQAANGNTAYNVARGSVTFSGMDNALVGVYLVSGGIDGLGIMMSHASYNSGGYPAYHQHLFTGLKNPNDSSSEMGTESHEWVRTGTVGATAMEWSDWTVYEGGTVDAYTKSETDVLLSHKADNPDEGEFAVLVEDSDNRKVMQYNILKLSGNEIESYFTIGESEGDGAAGLYGNSSGNIQFEADGEMKIYADKLYYNGKEVATKNNIVETLIVHIQPIDHEGTCDIIDNLNYDKINNAFNAGTCVKFLFSNKIFDEQTQESTTEEVDACSFMGDVACYDSVYTAHAFYYDGLSQRHLKVMVNASDIVRYELI